MGVITALKLGLAINNKLKQTENREVIIKALTESVEGKGQFSVVEWSVLGKQLEIFGNGNGRE